MRRRERSLVSARARRSAWANECVCWSTALIRSKRKFSLHCWRNRRSQRDAVELPATAWAPRSQKPGFVQAGDVRILTLTPSAAIVLADSFRRDVAQPGRALAWGARGRQFKSARPDQQYLCPSFRDLLGTPIFCF